VASVAAGPSVARILICEDSRTYATALKRFLEHDDGLLVQSIVSTGEQALAAVSRLGPDLVTMDIELPGMDGVETIKRILATRRVPILVVSSHTRRGSQLAAAALAAGAVDALSKDYLRIDALEGAAAVALRGRIKRLARTNAPRPARPANGGGVLAQTPGDTAGAIAGRRASVIAIGASTGGPHALLEVLSRLPPEYPVPVLIVQHMSDGFTTGLARWLDQQIPLPVAMAEAGSSPRRGVWFAPEGSHLVLDRALRMCLDGALEAGAHRPAADVLLTTVARAAGAGAVGVVLTGMGRDGAEGVAAIRAAGGLTIAQDEATSVVWGMPRAAAERGAQLVLPLEKIGLTLSGLTTRTGAR
jgi:two-component system chemotaxis response regulator CheB